MNESKTGGQYGVLSPWAEADPIPLKGLAPRLNGLSGKKIGLLFNYKRASRPILAEVQKKLKERFTNCEFSWYSDMRMGTSLIESPSKAEFEDWIKGVDAVIGAVGD